MIQAHRGDRLVINVQNDMVNSTSLHWHGMYQNGTNWMDGVSGMKIVMSSMNDDDGQPVSLSNESPVASPTMGLELFE
ncbi:hypothetical protein N7495_003761 [Penicillium taxi]|uniref:uncharacterized protein n=1 Tax=Penicillium taxi TaxID=168475 RepID=UPI00254585EC|nr:uncharacterized protein N7495_003761 [Penicillium taxi]KAJ5899017.1 hypothetical protein N7495_003761 [Penicillium taxi]